MDKKFACASITRDTFDDLLQQYPNVLPEKLTKLDHDRFETIPQSIQQRKTAGDAHLTKDEALTLIVWKVSHGKFRPTLKTLFLQNTEETVAATTREAFKAYKSATAEQAKPSLDILCKLRGIGPATASLFLSTYDPDATPFFSVGLLGWTTNKKGTGREWEYGIKYNVKEYLELFEGVQKLCKRLNVTAHEADKVAYVIGKTGQGLVPIAGEKRKTPIQDDSGNLKISKPRSGEIKTATRSSKRKKGTA